MIGWVVGGAALLQLVRMGVAYVSELNVKEPPFRVEREGNGYEIRFYEPYLVAEARPSVDADDPLKEGFRMLFAYITGANSGSRRIGMTAPVLQEKEPEKIPMSVPVFREAVDRGGVRVAFVLPAGFSEETAPLPADERISLRPVPHRRVAVIRFPGFATERLIAEKREELVRLLERDGIRRIGDFVEAYYNPPWTPAFMRRNEIMSEVAPLS